MRIADKNQSVDIEPGDAIKCHDPQDAADMAEQLGRLGYDWDFEYEINGEKGIWIIILKVPEGVSGE